MKITFQDNTTILRGLNEFQPEQIFDNGQSFRFTHMPDGSYEGVAFGRFLRVRREDNGDVTLSPCTQQDFEQIWYSYFDLERNYSALFPNCDDTALREGRQYAPGLRVLRQEPFETLISFIISANNNVARIRGIIHALCSRYGAAFTHDDRTFHAFPTPRALADATEQSLRDCGCGYRAPYILKTAAMTANGFDLAAIDGMPYEQAKARLRELPGVGPKVADCVLLFAYAKTAAFPADVWIKRVMRTLYGITGNDKAICAYAAQRFGECAGIAQQYLFYFARENKLL